ncbi:glycosyltransferase family 4 protein [candidate division KSB1 bacterium]|nr:glycosyltransferase family 4 protein [candidate division KSB1 bacterium]
MKIVQCCGSRSWGGLEMQTLKISQELKKRGHNVFIFCQQDSTLAAEGRKQHIPVAPVFYKGKNYFRKVYRTIKFLKHERPDVIHTHLSHDLWVIVPAMKIAGCRAKLFLTKRMASGVSKKDILHQFLYNRINRIFAISGYIKTSVLNTCPVPDERVVVMWNAISPETYQFNPGDRKSVREEFNIDPATMVVGFIGRFSPGKGQPEFLQAAKVIKQKYTHPISFIIIGGASYGEADYEKEIRGMAQSLNFTDDLIFTGFRKDIPRLLAGMDILAFPSHEESFGNVLLEAMAIKIPVVASNSGGVPDIVLDEKTGILVPPKNAEKLAAGLTELIMNADLRARYAAAGRERVEKYFNLNFYMDTLERFYSGDSDN